MLTQPVSSALESSSQSPCAGQLWKEDPLCSRDNPQGCTRSTAAAQKTSASPTTTLGYPIHVGSQIHSQFGGCGFSSHLMAAGVRRTTARKHTGLPARHVQSSRPLQTPDSDKGYSRAGKLLCFAPKDSSWTQICCSTTPHQVIQRLIFKSNPTIPLKPESFGQRHY